MIRRRTAVLRSAVTVTSVLLVCGCGGGSAAGAPAVSALELPTIAPAPAVPPPAGLTTDVSTNPGPSAAGHTLAPVPSPLASPDRPADPATVPFPVAVDLNDQRQIVTVKAASARSTTGTLVAWQRGDTGAWTAVFGPVQAYLGQGGVGRAAESLTVTPVGTFPMTQAFGVEPDPGSGLPYAQIGLDDWWVSDVDSPDYNTLQHCAEAVCPFSTSVSEQLGAVTTEYRYAVVIDYNRTPVVAGAGSAFFLHVAAGKPTSGCVSIAASTLVPLMKWLDPAQSPGIAIGVG